MLVVFKYTSNQKAIQQARNGIKANLLALSLFKENMFVGLRCQGALLGFAAKLLAFSLVPMLVMFVPMSLLLGQLSLWFQVRPLKVNEEAIVSVNLQKNQDAPIPEVRLLENSAVTTIAGPVRVPTKQMICWRLRAIKPGLHQVQFEVAGQSVSKELAIGDSLMPSSLKRPAWNLVDVMLYPREEPFVQSSLVQSIEIDYPERSSWTIGTNTWLIYWFLISMVSALAARPWLKVHI